MGFDLNFRNELFIVVLVVVLHTYLSSRNRTALEVNPIEQWAHFSLQ